MSEEKNDKAEKTIHPFTTTAQIDGKDQELNLAIRKPSGQEGIEAQKIYSKAWNEAFNTRSLLRAQVNDELVKRGLWSDEKEKELTEKAKELQGKLDTLKKGGGKLKDAKELALNARKLRYEFNRLALDKNVLDNNTVEGQAEAAKINYLISVCTVYNHGSKKSYFKSLEDYYNRSAEKATIEAANAFMAFVYNLDEDFEKKYPENEFLLKYKFINDKLQVLNSDGKPYDPDVNKLINDKGQWINGSGDLINIDDQPVNEDGSLKIETEPFVDEDGNPVSPVE